MYEYVADSVGATSRSSGDCVQSAPVVCATATTTTTPTPTPTGTCYPRCPDYAAHDVAYISQQVNSTTGISCFYDTSCSTDGLGYHLCEYNVRLPFS